MKIVFFGSDFFSIAILEYLLKHTDCISHVVTKPDKEMGRNRTISPAPVKAFLQKQSFLGKISQPQKASSAEFCQALKQENADLFLVVSYGEILKKEVLDIPPLGVINVHPSLLPKFRGPSPVETALLLGEKETGVTIMKMALAMDAGDIIFQEKIPITPCETRESLYQKIFSVSGKLLLKLIEFFEIGMTIPLKEQNHAQATFTRKFTKEDFRCHVQDSFLTIDRKVRAFSPSPGAFIDLWINGEGTTMKWLKICQSTDYKKVNNQFPPGEIVQFDKNRFCVACQDSILEILTLQLAGKKVMDAKQFFNGFRNKILKF